MNQVPSSVHCLVAIVDRGKSEAVAEELRRRRILTQLVLLGHGTASAEVMDLLGLDEPEKDVVLALVPGAAGGVLAALTERPSAVLCAPTLTAPCRVSELPSTTLNCSGIRPASVTMAAISRLQASVRPPHII